jgi:DNA polymerase-3 subunit delta'
MPIDLLLHPRTQASLEALLAAPSQAVLIVGDQGAGKDSVLSYLAAQLLDIPVNSSNPYHLDIDPDERSISIDEIRRIQRFITLKVARQKPGINRVVTIRRANRLGGEAQNALLKMLEEPPVGTCIILSVEAPAQLAETVLSRLRHISVLPVSESSAIDYFTKKGIPLDLVVKNYALSQGYVGLLSMLLNNPDHPLLSSVQTARSILADPPGMRLFMSEQLAKDKPEVVQLLDAFLRISHAALVVASNKQSTTQLIYWLKVKEATLKAQQDLLHNAQPKLLLDHFFLSF